MKKYLTDKDTPFVNHAIAEQYPPGSTYKLVTGTGALQDKKISRTTEVLSKPYVQVGPDKYWEWNKRGWGPLNIVEGFGHSSDTFFYQLSAMLGIDRLAYWAKQFGFGRSPGSTCPVRSRASSRRTSGSRTPSGQEIFPGETLQAGIGQGFDVATPLQVLNAYAALANGGKLYRPQVVREDRRGGREGRPAVHEEAHPQAVGLVGEPPDHAARGAERRDEPPRTTS
jgi:penicillin-binding protein 2